MLGWCYTSSSRGKRREADVHAKDELQWRMVPSQQVSKESTVDRSMTERERATLLMHFLIIHMTAHVGIVEILLFRPD